MNHPHFEIAVQDLGGWVRVFLTRGEPTIELALLLSRTLATWFRQNPNLQMRCVIPINRDGTTVELHAWYDQTRFPDTSTPATPPGPGPFSGTPSKN